MNGVTLALGGGGVRGVAHVLVLEALDDLGVPVAGIAGSSIGAVVGTMHASGMTGRDIRGHFGRLGGHRRHLIGRLRSSHALSLRGVMRARKTGWSPLDAHAVLREFLPTHLPGLIENLAIPTAVVASCMETEKGVGFREGPLRDALAASIAIPGLMRPVRVAGRLHVDGSVLDPVPVRHVPPGGGLVLAVDINGEATGNEPDAPMPSAVMAAMRSARMMTRAITASHLGERPDALVIRPPLPPMLAMEFHRLDEAFAALLPFRDQVRRSVGEALERDG